MAYSFQSYPGDGTTTLFSIPFPYVQQSHVQVRVDGVLKAAGVDYTFPTASSIQFSVAPGNGVIVQISRFSGRDARVVNFENGATLTESVLDRNSDQCFFVAQEAFDAADTALQITDQDTFDAGGSRIVNVGDAQDAQDSVTKAQLDAAVINAAGYQPEAASIEFVPSGDVTSTNVQEALEDIIGSRLGVFAPLYPGVDPTGATDSASGIATAIADAAGRPVYFPAGTYRVNSQLTYTTTSSDVFTPGLKIIGAGVGKTIFDTRVANGHLFGVDSNTAAKFQMGVEFKGFSIRTNSPAANSDGLYLRRAYHVAIENVEIKGLTRDGVRIEVNEGDNDGSNMVSLRHVRIDSCLGWGINCNMGTGLNELSFLRGDHVFIQSCGTTSMASTPPSGGMRWRGQVLDWDNSAFVICENIGLYVMGGSGLGNTISIDGTAFENNKKGHCLIEGLDAGAFRNIQLYSNDSYVATFGIKLDGTSSTIRNILVDGVVVRATAGNNAYTAFVSTGGNVANRTVEVANVSWPNFDYAGQTRYSGEFIRDEVLSWTPTLTFATQGDLTVIYGTQLGRYTKTRDGTVRAYFQIVTTTFTHTTASGELRITGLPFTAENTAGIAPIGSVQWAGITKANYTDVTSRVDPNTSYIVCQISGSGQALANVVATDTPTAGTVVLRGTVEYRAAT